MQDFNFNKMHLKVPHTKCWPFLRLWFVKPWLHSESMHTSWVIFLVLICQSFIQSYDDLFLMNHLVSGEYQSELQGGGSKTMAIKTHMMVYLLESPFCIDTMRPRENGPSFPDDMFQCIFMNENLSISIKISLKFVSTGPINNISALVQIMAWRYPCNEPLPEPMMVSLPMHICVTRP